MLPIIFATALVSLISFIGVLIMITKKLSPKVFKILIALASGSLLTVALLDLLPEAIEESSFEPHLIFTVVLTSFIIFFLLERVFHWHHCTCQEEGTHAHRQHLIYINLIGDGVHNILDGFLIAGAFLLNVETGLIVTAAVILHEIPQELSDTAILLYGGLSKAKTIMFNLLTAATAIIGATLFYYFSAGFATYIPLVTAFAAGNFLYLAAADLIPELHHETNPRQVVIHSIMVLLGVALMVTLISIVPHVN